MKDWLMIVNPASASSSRKGNWKDCVRQLSEGGLSVECRLSDYPGHSVELARAAAAEGFRKLISVGGDGTIHELMTGLLRWCDAEKADMGDFTLAVVPVGTGNDWIRTAGIPADMSAAVQCILAGHTAREDVVRLTFENGTYCMANVGGIGLDADICYYTNKLKKRGYRGGLLYKVMTPYPILVKKRDPVEIVCDGELFFKGRFYSAVIGNGIYRGGGVRQNEAGGAWDDGLLELSVMPAVSRARATVLMARALSGNFAVQPGILSRRFRRMTVTPLGTPDRFESDGEIPGTLPVTVELTGQQIKIIVP